jgi:hypothetical protein
MTGASSGIFDKTVQVNLKGPFFPIQKNEEKFHAG